MFAEISLWSAIRVLPRSAFYTHSEEFCYLLQRKSSAIASKAGISQFDSCIQVLILTVNDGIALKYCLEISDNYSTP
jgi:hypothetical protein